MSQPEYLIGFALTEWMIHQPMILLTDRYHLSVCFANVSVLCSLGFLYTDRVLYRYQYKSLLMMSENTLLESVSVVVSLILQTEMKRSNWKIICHWYAVKAEIIVQFSSYDLMQTFSVYICRIKETAWSNENKLNMPHIFTFFFSGNLFKVICGHFQRKLQNLKKSLWRQSNLGDRTP